MITDPIQILLAVVIIALSILLFVVGLELYKLLKETRQSLQKANKIIDDIEFMTDSVVVPVGKLAQIVQGMQQGFSTIANISSFVENRFGSKEKTEK